MDGVVQQNAASSEELASTAEELAGQALSLTDTVGFFRLGGDGLRRAEVLTVAAPEAAAHGRRPAAHGRKAVGRRPTGQNKRRP